jgi:hypothetical protein
MSSITDIISKDTMALRLTQLLTAEEIIAALNVRYKEIKKTTIVTAVNAIFASALPIPEPAAPIIPEPPAAAIAHEEPLIEESTSSIPRERQIPTDEIRCCARVFYEDQHLTNGKIKKMREDSMNCYGDRCKFKRSGETSFCKHHAEKQACGVWNGIYEGKLQFNIIYKQ